MDKKLKVIGVIGIYNTASINIHEINEREEYIIVSINNIKPCKRKLYFNTKGVYFNFVGRNYLNEAIIVN